MSRTYRSIAFTGSVLASQVEYGSRAALSRVDRQAASPVTDAAPEASSAGSPTGPGGEERGRARDPMGPGEREFVHQLRLEIFGYADLTDVHRSEQYSGPLATPGYRGRVEREVRTDVSAFDWNCPQHITPRYAAGEPAHIADRLPDLTTRFRAQEEQR